MNPHAPPSPDNITEEVVISGFVVCTLSGYHYTVATQGMAWHVATLCNILPSYSHSSYSYITLQLAKTSLSSF